MNIVEVARRNLAKAKASGQRIPEAKRLVAKAVTYKYPLRYNVDGVVDDSVQRREAMDAAKPIINSDSPLTPILRPEFNQAVEGLMKDKGLSRQEAMRVLSQALYEIGTWGF